jgi:beta-glucanase (GH16 family)
MRHRADNRLSLRSRVRLAASVTALAGAVALSTVALAGPATAELPAATPSPPTATSPSIVHPGRYWRDDFTRFDDAVWNRINRTCFARENVGVADGMLWLRIVPDPANVDCFGVTGARINTYGKKEFPAGTFSARIKYVTAPGSWQTFWLTGNNGEVFPGNGEIDIAEVIGRMPRKVPHNMHSSRLSAPLRKCSQGGDPYLKPNNTWRVYEVTTSDTEVVFRVDGKVAGRYTGNGVCSWPFGDPMRILFSARGGQYGGKVNPAKYPVTYYVDWVQWRAS